MAIRLRLNPEPIQRVDAAISAWYADRNASHIPPQRQLLDYLEQAGSVCAGIELTLYGSDVGHTDTGFLDLHLLAESRLAWRGDKDNRVTFGDYDHARRVFFELCRGKGYVRKSSDLLNAGWDSTAVRSNLQREVSRIREIIKPLQLGVESVRGIGHRLVEKT